MNPYFEGQGVRNNMLHPASEEVEAYVAGSMSDADRAVLESHLIGCEQCTTEVEEWRALFTGLAALPYLDPTPGFADRVMAGVRIHQPWPARVAALLRRLAPTTTMGWFLVTAIVSLPVLTMGGALTWLLSRPWLSLDALWIFITFRAEAALFGIAKRAGTLVIESQTTLWVVDGVKQLLTWMGAPGIGAAAAIGAALISLSVWTLYQNLFRHSTRGGSHATT
jgi:anti-sigma factor RsiW